MDEMMKMLGAVGGMGAAKGEMVRRLLVALFIIGLVRNLCMLSTLRLTLPFAGSSTSVCVGRRAFVSLTLNQFVYMYVVV